MPSNTSLRGFLPLKPRIVRLAWPRPASVATRQTHAIAGLPTTAPGLRPRIVSAHQTLSRTAGQARRSMFIQTENTPNPDALKFLPNQRVLPDTVTTPFVEYMSPRATISPPYPSPLAAKLMAIDGVTSVFYGADFITVSKAADANWAYIRPEVFSLITEAVTSGQAIISMTQRSDGDSVEDEAKSVEQDSLAYDEKDSEVVGMIKELLETRIRPAIQEDGGDVEFCGFENGRVLLKLRGACRTCDSSTVTLKNGIEGMLMHYVEEVKGVEQIMDKEEEMNVLEFAKFEEKLKRQRREAPHGSLGTVPG